MRIFRKLWDCCHPHPLFFLWFLLKKIWRLDPFRTGSRQLRPRRPTPKPLRKKPSLWGWGPFLTLKNYIDELEEKGKGDYKPEDQYGVLFGTLDQLVIRNGPGRSIPCQRPLWRICFLCRRQIKKICPGKRISFGDHRTGLWRLSENQPRKYSLNMARKKIRQAST